MPAVKTTLEWNGGMSFATELQGHRLTVDAESRFGGQNRGPRPKPLVLTALGGCTGMDVVSLLNKMQMPFDALAVEVEGEAREEHPQVYTRLHLRYILKGNALDRDKIDKAIGLSLDKYCAVHAMLAKSVPISHEVVLNPS
jgi:putative redox protein